MITAQIVGAQRPGVMVPIVTWDPADKAADVTLSNGNLTAASVSFGWKSARSTLAYTTGKKYFEVSFDAIGSYGLAGIHLEGPLGTYTGSNSLGMGWNTAGERYNAGAPVAALTPTWANGDRLCVAVNIGTGMAWARKNNTGWNSVAGGSQDPAAGLGGIPLPAAMLSGNLFASVSVQFAGTDISTGCFNTASFLNPVPAGFSAWSG